jgi:hypothetical protein
MPRENTDDLELAYYRETYAGFVGGIAWTNGNVYAVSMTYTTAS